MNCQANLVPCLYIKRLYSNFVFESSSKLLVYIYKNNRVCGRLQERPLQLCSQDDSLSQTGKISDYSRYGNLTNLARCFAPALLQSIAASFISATSLETGFSFPSKILAFRSAQIVPHTIMIRERAPLLLVVRAKGLGYRTSPQFPF
jgi:hypothetical protein